VVDQINIRSDDENCFESESLSIKCSWNCWFEIADSWNQISFGTDTKIISEALEGEERSEKRGEDNKQQAFN